MDRQTEPERLAPSQLTLHFMADGQRRTWLDYQNVAYPFHVGRCLSLPDDPAGMATVYVQSCSGGIFEGDRLQWQIQARKGAQAHVTTAASTIVHGMEQGDSQQTILLDVHEGALLEYLPEASILFPGAQLSNRVCVRWHPTATVLLWDTVLSHDPQADDSVGPGRWFRNYRSELSVTDADGRLLARDRYTMSGNALAQGLPGLIGGHTCQASFALLHSGVDAALKKRLRDILHADKTVYAGVSDLPNGCGVFVRLLARDAAELRIVSNETWAACRESLLGVRPGLRRK